MPNDTRVPVTVLTGFLGSGKTTLLNRILTANHGKRIAVIENEFGEIGVDQDLVIHSDEEIFEMNNGCLCCTVRGDLIRILGNLMKRRDKFDNILIETTGMADPGPVAQTFFMDDELLAKTRLDGVVTLVDAKHVALHWESHEVKEQVAFADLLLLNKSDLVSSAELDALETKMKRLNGLATIVRTVQAQVELDQVLNIGGFSLDRVLEHEPDFLKAAAKPKPALGLTVIDDHAETCHDATCEHPDHTHDHTHDESITSVGIVEPGSVNSKKLNEWLGNLLQVQGENIYRMKGVLNLKGDEKRFVFQGVHMMFDGQPDRNWKPDEPRVNKLVFIGKELNRTELVAGFRSCLA
jgi:G3E family GTPase